MAVDEMIRMPTAQPTALYTNRPSSKIQM
jgi:hypothetical protein